MSFSFRYGNFTLSTYVIMFSMYLLNSKKRCYELQELFQQASKKKSNHKQSTQYDKTIFKKDLLVNQMINIMYFYLYLHT